MTDKKRQEEMFLVDANLGWFHIFREMINSGDLKKLMKGSPSSVGVYLVIKSMVNRHTGISFPSVDTIMERTGISKGTAHKCLDVLEELGYIEKQKSKSGNKNIYRVREKIMGTNKETAEQSVITFDYLSSTLSEATTEIKNYLQTGKQNGNNKFIHIDSLTINLQNNFGDNNKNTQTNSNSPMDDERLRLLNEWREEGVAWTEIQRRERALLKGAFVEPEE